MSEGRIKGKMIKNLSRMGLPYILRNLKGESITILCLHRISPENSFFFDPIKPETFESLIQYSLKHYEITTFAEINKKTKKPKLILSFDDGYYDFVEYAVPVLSQYNLPSNHNLVNACLNGDSTIWTQTLIDIFDHLKGQGIIKDEALTGLIGPFNNHWFSYYIKALHYLLECDIIERHNVLNQLVTKYNILSSAKMMSWEDARKCIADYKVEVGSHTYRHESLLSATKEDELEEEIGHSILELESKLQIKINILSLPNGQYNKEVLCFAKNYGIRYVLLTDDKVNQPKQVANNFNLVNRVYMLNESLEEVILRVELFHQKVKKLL